MRVAIVGAGALGGFVGAELAVGGAEVSLLGRPGREPRRIRAIRDDGTEVVGPSPLTTVSSTEHLAGADAVIVAVKSRDTPAVARELAETLRAETPVLTLQNGLDNGALLAARLGPRVRTGVVTYNVCIDGEGRRRQASRGKVILERPSRRDRTMLDLAWCLERGGERIDLRRDIRSALAGKLLVNLQNGISAATGLPLAELLLDRDARLCFADCVEEGFEVLRACGFSPARVTFVPPRLLPAVLRLPDEIVSLAVTRALGIQPEARSSMLQDIERGAPTEIDELNGAIVRLARAQGRAARHNAVVVAAVREIEARSDAALRAPFVSSRELRRWMTRIPHGTRLAASAA